MELFKSLNEQLAAVAKEENEIRDMIAEIEVAEAKNLFRLDEIFTNKKKKEAEERRKRLMARGKIGSVERNKEGDWQGGVMGSGRLAELVKQFGKPVFDKGNPPRRPNGMTLEDYKLWLEGFEKERRESELGPAVGPAVGDFVRVKGELFRVKSSEDLSAIIANKEGKKAKVSWNSLSKPKEIDGHQVFTYMGN